MVTPIVTEAASQGEQHGAARNTASPRTPPRGSLSPSRGSSFRGAMKQQSTNKNVNWLNSPGSWIFIVAMILAGWLMLSIVLPSGVAWTYINLIHGFLSYYLLHWKKGSPIEMDQGKYDRQTFWEQLDDGVQYTSNRKFFTIIPVVLFLLATNGSDFKKQPLGLNMVVLVVLLIAKLPSMHKVRIFGINKY